MRVLLTVLSVLAGWAFLLALGTGLLAILNALADVRGHFEKIAAGVRAIERQTQPLGREAERLAGSLSQTSAALNAAARRMDDAGRDLNAASPALRARS